MKNGPQNFEHMHREVFAPFWLNFGVYGCFTDCISCDSVISTQKTIKKKAMGSSTKTSDPIKLKKILG